MSSLYISKYVCIYCCLGDKFPGPLGEDQPMDMEQEE